MVGFNKQLVTAAAVFTVVQAHPRGGPSFQLGNLNPAWAVKRALYNLDDISDQGHKDKLTQGLKDAVTIVAKTLEKMDDDKYKPRLEYWFGKEKSDDNAREIIRQVYKNIVGENKDGTGSDTIGQVSVFTDDYWKPPKDWAPGVDGNTAFCSITIDSKTGTAYYRSKDGKPAMHFCDKVWDRADLATLTADSCLKLGDLVSTVAWSKNFLGANVLHEYMHYNKIGKDAVGAHIGDVVYDAYQCSQLAVDKDEERRKKTIVNADTYVWYALDIAFTDLCGKDFSRPRSANDDDETNQDWPDSDEADNQEQDTGPPPANKKRDACTPPDNQEQDTSSSPDYEYEKRDDCTLPENQEEDSGTWPDNQEQETGTWSDNLEEDTGTWPRN